MKSLLVLCLITSMSVTAREYPRDWENQYDCTKSWKKQRRADIPAPADWYIPKSYPHYSSSYDDSWEDRWNDDRFSNDSNYSYDSSNDSSSSSSNNDPVGDAVNNFDFMKDFNF